MNDFTLKHLSLLDELQDTFVVITWMNPVISILLYQFTENKIELYMHSDIKDDPSVTESSIS